MAADARRDGSAGAADADRLPGIIDPSAVTERSALLRAAADQVRGRIRDELAHVEVSQRDLMRRLDELVGVVEAGEGAARYRGLVLTESATIQWLVDELRGGMLNAGTTAAGQDVAGDSGELIPLLVRLEAVRQQLAAASDQQLARLLTSLRALELLVELAHDLRSPLTSIIFLSEVLRQQQSGKVNGLQARQLGIIYTAAHGMVAMASDVIELVRGDRLTASEPTSFSVSELLSSIRDLVDPIVETKALSLRLHSPEVDRRLGFPVALSRVLLNLTTNALKFTQEGYVEVAVRELGTDRLEFSVQDTGPGLKADAGDLFSAIRFNPTGERHGFSGSGLGLAICRRLLAAMDAELRCESVPGEGARFYFELTMPPA